MKWASAVGLEAEPGAAIRSALSRLRERLGAPADLLLIFGAGRGADAFDEQVAHLRREQDTAVVLGCTALGVAAEGRELEGIPAVALVGASLPGVRIQPFGFEGGGVPEIAELRRALGGDAEPPRALLLLADPFSFASETWLERLHGSFPGCASVGGLASGGRAAGDHRLCAGERLQRDGLVGVALRGAIALDTIVAQGCRPIGVPLFITRAQGNRVLELDGRPPAALLQELFDGSAPEDRRLFQGSLFAGLEMGEGRTRLERGDFLVRNILGIDARSGAIAIAAPLRERQILQFQLRDRRASSEDLELRLARYRERHEPAALRGALLFSCVGRGAGLYGTPDHDTRAFRRAFGAVPLGGFFGNGELGPVEGRTYLHAYTSAFGVFRQLE